MHMLSACLVSPSALAAPPELMVQDPEAFFLFMAENMEEQGEWITPLDLDDAIRSSELDAEAPTEEASNEEEVKQ